MLIMNRPWSPLDWTPSDDRVRGGASVSKLDCTPFEPVATFHGNLDIKTLGGAGFASQRSTGEDRNWDLSGYDGIFLDITKSDGKQYTFILKDELLPKSLNGREQSTISWEYDFKPQDSGEKVYLRWEDLKPTYRGREKKDAKPLDLKHVERISLMMRRFVYFRSSELKLTRDSFFGTQEGDFSMSVASISAFKKNDSVSHRNDPATTGIASDRSTNTPDPTRRTWLGWLSQCMN